MCQSLQGFWRISLKTCIFSLKITKRFKEDVRIRATPFCEKFKDFKHKKGYDTKMTQTKFVIDIKRYSGVIKKKT